MPKIARDKACGEIVELLNDMVYKALSLKEALAEEHQALQGEDMDGLGQAVSLKAACIDELRDLDDRRDALCSSWDFPSGPSQMQRVIDWCDENGLIRSHWDHLLLIAAESNAMNLTNGAVIRVRQKQFETSLSVLRGAASQVGTYGPQGETTSDLHRQSLAQA